jgi:hypothetical protein
MSNVGVAVDHAMDGGVALRTRISQVALLGLVFVSVADSQPVARRIAIQPACARCTIDIVRVASLGSPQDSVLIAPFPAVTRDSRGRYYVLSIDRRQLIAFDSRGKYLRAFGQSGQGPGEIAASRITRFAVGSGDTLLVAQGSRLVIFDPSYQGTRTLILPSTSIAQIEGLPSGEILIGASVRTAGNFGFPFHLLDKNGAVIRSFGEATVNHHLAYNRPLAQNALPPRFVLTADKKGIWIAPAGRVREWTLNGRAGNAFDVVNPSWFPPGRDTLVADRTGKATVPVKLGAGAAEILGVDRQGVLWLSSGYGGNGGRPARWWLTAIDTKTQTVIAEADVTNHPAGNLAPMTDGLVFSVKENQDGVVTVHIFQLSLRGR